MSEQVACDYVPDVTNSDDVPWLDAEEQAVWFKLTCLLIRLPSALDAQLRRDAGLSHFEYQILAALSMTESRTLPMSDIAAFTESSLSRLSHACKRLEAHQWVERRPDPEDGRVTLASLTAAGHAKIAEAAPGHVRAVRQIVFNPLNKQQLKQLGQIVDRIEAALPPPGS